MPRCCCAARQQKHTPINATKKSFAASAGGSECGRKRKDTAARTDTQALNNARLWAEILRAEMLRAAHRAVAGLGQELGDVLQAAHVRQVAAGD